MLGVVDSGSSFTQRTLLERGLGRRGKVDKSGESCICNPDTICGIIKIRGKKYQQKFDEYHVYIKYRGINTYGSPFVDKIQNLCEGEGVSQLKGYNTYHF